MGIYDRDYYRREGPSFLTQLAVRGRVTKWLIIVNVAMFFVQLATIERADFGGVKVRIGDGPFTNALALDPEQVTGHGEVWRLLSYAFLHSTTNLLHILFNMLILWWVGTEIEERYGGKEFLAFYLVAAVFSGLAYMLFPMGGLARGCVGASGAVVATLVVFACHYPNRTVLFMFVIPMPVWALAAGFVAWDLIRYLTKADTEVAVTAHLGGAVFGFLYYKLQWKLTGMLGDWRGWKKKRARPQLRVYREDPEETPTPVGVAAQAADADEHLEARLDAVLEKLSLVGRDNLTEEEKQLLQQASEFYSKRRRDR